MKSASDQESMRFKYRLKPINSTSTAKSPERYEVCAGFSTRLFIQQHDSDEAMVWTCSSLNLRNLQLE